MKIINAYVLLEDAFSGCKKEKVVSLSQSTFERLKNSVGKTTSHFDKAAQIRYDYTIKEVRQANQTECNQLNTFIA